MRDEWGRLYRKRHMDLFLFSSASRARYRMGQCSGSIGRWVVTLGLGLLGGCAAAAGRPFVQVAGQATGDGLSPGTAVRFGPMPRDPLMFVRSEWAWLESHGYTRVEGEQIESTFAVVQRRLRFFHVWPVRDAAGRKRKILFDKTEMVGLPIEGRKQ